MKKIVTIAAIVVGMLFVTESAKPAPPIARPTPPSATASFTFSTTWYFVSRKPRWPRPLVRS